MDAEYGLSRSSLDMHLDPSPGSSVVHALRPQERLRILGRAGDSLEVESTRWQPPVRGFVPASSVVQSSAPSASFPQVDLAPGIRIPAVPISLPLVSFIAWLQTQDESPWLPPRYLDAIRRGEQPSVGQTVRGILAAQQPEWDAWVGEVIADGRLQSATLDEWIVRRQGGRNMWSIRAERIFTDASEHASSVGWVVPEDVLRWTGRVRSNEREPKYRLWYEVELDKGGRNMRGWYKASLLDEFFAPTPQTDIALEQNRLTVFELARPVLRLPADPEIDDSRRAGRAGAQYIDVRRALGSGKLHHHLCGEFCAAALAGVDVIDLLQKWLPFYPRAHEILTNDRGTSIPDLQSMLDAFGLKHEYYRAVGSTSPVTPNYVRRRLDMGMLGIVFTGVTPHGVVSSRSPIRHWVVVEDILRIGSGGWLRIYNPFTNREETYLFDEVFDLPARDSIGLWVEPGLAGGSEGAALKVALPQPQELAQPQPQPVPHVAEPAMVG
jgi:hypothetical protein